jgi:hypothetical protein
MSFTSVFTAVRFVVLHAVKIAVERRILKVRLQYDYVRYSTPSFEIIDELNQYIPSKESDRSI